MLRAEGDFPHLGAMVPLAEVGSPLNLPGPKIIFFDMAAFGKRNVNFQMFID